jgi:hypothetical protein
MFVSKRFWAVFLTLALLLVLLSMPFDMVVVDGHSCENPNPSLRLANGDVLLGISARLSGIKVGDFAYAYHDGMDVLKRVEGVTPEQVLLEGTNPVQNLQENPGWIPVSQVRGKIIARLFSVSRTATVDRPEVVRKRAKMAELQLCDFHPSVGCVFLRGGWIRIGDEKMFKTNSLYPCAVLSESGSLLAFTNSEGRVDVARVADRAITSTQVSGRPTAVCNSGLLAIEQQSKGVGIYDFTSFPTKLQQFLPETSGLRFSPDGQRAVLVFGADDLMMFDVKDGAVVGGKKVTKATTPIFWLDDQRVVFLSMDGRKLMVLGGGSSRELTSSETWLSWAACRGTVVAVSATGKLLNVAMK